MVIQIFWRAALTVLCADFSGIMPEVSIDPMKVVEDAVLEVTDKKDLFLAYMSSMFIGDQGMLMALVVYSSLNVSIVLIGKSKNSHTLKIYQHLLCILSLLVLGEPIATPVVNVVTEKGSTFLLQF